ncbi:hypothetical protein WH47_09094 [Habropoda laboriosa]|uniref:Uncharacterized protein n=1 Tax=Habropoda laboriosa TaxID=597456 RepID=A0A0L7QNN3_9HYME|nr:hypothetical protein WH47_09094 [Habropoda laboriosa]
MCTYNDGASSVLKILKELMILIGPSTLEWCETWNNIHVRAADRRASLSTKEGRIETRRKRKAIEDLNQSREGVIYEPGIDRNP